MSVQPINVSLANVQNSYSYSVINFTTPDSNATTGGLGSDQQSSEAPSVQTTLLSEQYSSESLLLNYTNKDGDTLSLSAQSIDYQKEIQAANSDPTDDGWKKIIAEIKDQYAQMKADLVNQLFGNGQDSGQTSAPVQDPRSFDETKAIPGLPDYWNAENTSQRIVDFATSFLSAFKGSGADFLNTIKDAIDQGFSQAKDMFGDVPNAVGQLTDKTHALVMDKLDAWAKAQGITADASSDQTDTAAATVQAS
jgi:Domain of unknown function (DUF5610)